LAFFTFDLLIFFWTPNRQFLPDWVQIFMVEMARSALSFSVEFSTKKKSTTFIYWPSKFGSTLLGGGKKAFRGKKVFFLSQNT
jgi:hypothetical protein